MGGAGWVGMNPMLEQLVMLQAIDLDLARLEKLRTELPRRVARAEAQVTEAQRAREQALAGMKKEDLLRREQQRQIDEHAARISRLRRQLDAATSTAQVTALEHELQFAESAVRGLEDEELASMERSEVLEAAERKAAAECVSAEAGLQTERTRTEESRREVERELAERAAERTAVRAGIEEAALSHYDRVAKSRGTGVAEGVDHKCAACQMMVRPQRWNDLTSGDAGAALLHCETCGRVLFHDPRRDRPGPWAPGERLDRARALAAQ